MVYCFSEILTYNSGADSVLPTKRKFKGDSEEEEAEGTRKKQKTKHVKPELESHQGREIHTHTHMLTCSTLPHCINPTQVLIVGSFFISPDF